MMQNDENKETLDHVPKHSAGLIGFCGGVFGLGCCVSNVGRCREVELRFVEVL